MRSVEEILAPAERAYAAHPQADVPAGARGPAAVGLPESADEVCALVDHARAEGLRVAVHTTGRGVRQTGPLDDTLLIRTAGLAGAWLDAPAEVVRAAGGSLWSDVSRVAAPAGLAAPAVTTPSVGVAGSVLAGGVGWLGRRHGLASESLSAVELVTGDDRLLRADAEHERDLFWALRGGGGGLGVVTAVELRVVATGAMHAGLLAWPGARAADVLHAWREWTYAAPREATSIARLVGGRSEPAAYLEAVVLAGAGDAAALLQPLRALAPERDTFAPCAPAALDTLHFDVLGERPVYYDHLLLDELPGEALDAFLEVAGPDARFPILDVELRHLGGALNDRARDCGALGALDAGYLLVVAADPAAAPIARDVVDAMSPWAAGHIFPSFADEGTSRTDVFRSETLPRLAAVKALYDPEDRFLSAPAPSPVR